VTRMLRKLRRRRYHRRAATLTTLIADISAVLEQPNLSEVDRDYWLTKRTKLFWKRNSTYAKLKEIT
jgi:hypothetical protein